jgi:hypothetical protein
VIYEFVIFEENSLVLCHQKLFVLNNQQSTKYESNAKRARLEMSKAKLSDELLQWYEHTHLGELVLHKHLQSLYDYWLLGNVPMGYISHEGEIGKSEPQVRDLKSRRRQKDKCVATLAVSTRNHVNSSLHYGSSWVAYLFLSKSVL